MMRLITLATLIILIPVFSFAQPNQSKTADDVVRQIKQNITCEWAEKTVDTFKAGDPKSRLTGIAVCMFADMHVLKEAVNKNCNFIITHEPVFYNHLDETSAFLDDPVYLEKAKFIKENKLIIFRFHDHIHRTEPDGISVGMINKMDLNNYSVGGSQTFFEVPKTTLAKFSKELKNKFGLKSIRVIGNLKMKFSKVAFMAGAPGGQNHIQILSNPDVEVLIAGEAPEWETYLYANDAVAQEKNKAVIFVGHIKSEEAGMEYCTEWLQSFIKEIPIHFIENQPNFIQL